jgi:hypothetical protein
MDRVVKISIKEFLRTGQFGPVRLSMSRDQIYQSFGEPDAIASAKRKARHPTTLLYGNIELWFSGSEPNQLSALFSDDFDLLRGNERLQVDSWEIKGEMSAATVMSALAKAAIPFWIAQPLAPNTHVMVIGPGIIFSFIVDQEPYASPPGLNSIYYASTHPYQPLAAD